MTSVARTRTKRGGPPRWRSARGPGAVDGASAPCLEFAPPVADWIIFLAERLATEFLREAGQEREAP
jgi:hypothetical protein